MSSKNPRDPGTPRTPGDPHSPAGAPREARDKLPHADGQEPPGQESASPLPGADPPEGTVHEQIRDSFVTPTDLDGVESVPGQDLTSALGAEQALSTPSDEPDDLAESFWNSEVAEYFEIFQKASLLSRDDPTSIIETVALGAPTEEEDAPASRGWEPAPSPLVAPPGALKSSLHVPDGWQESHEPSYSDSFRRVLWRAYIALARAPGTLHAHADAFRAVEGWESSQMSARQRTRMNYVMGICYAAVGDHQVAVAYLDEACLGACQLGDWGGAAECAHLAGLIYAALGDCVTAAEYFSICLDCLDYY